MLNQRILLNQMDSDKILAGIKMLIEGLGEDISREGLIDTPRRVSNIWEACFQENAPTDDDLLKQSFSVENYKDFVIVRNIHFSSFCEHHLLPFFGKISVAYLPKDNSVIGLSKIVRIVDKYSKRLQLQERLTQQILDALSTHLDNDGVMVVVTAQHMCITTRGVMNPGTEAITRATAGKFSEDKSLTIEAQQLIFSHA